jgi:hypothetical protein
MRRKVWSDREVDAQPGPAMADNPSPPADRMQELLALIDGGEGGGGTPCSVGVPPWFLAAAHDRLAEMTRGSEHAGTIEAVFGEGRGATPQAAPDKVALALAAMDETFRAEIMARGAGQPQDYV